MDDTGIDDAFQNLLTQQLALAQQVLSVHKEILKRCGRARSGPNATILSVGASDIEPQSVQPQAMALACQIDLDTLLPPEDLLADASGIVTDLKAALECDTENGAKVASESAQDERNHAIPAMSASDAEPAPVVHVSHVSFGASEICSTRSERPDADPSLCEPLLPAGLETSDCSRRSSNATLERGLTNCSMESATSRQSAKQSLKRASSRLDYLISNKEKTSKRVLENLQKDNYNVEDYYKQSGCCQSIARNYMFQNVALAVIGLNTAWIAYETDENHAQSSLSAPLVFKLGDNAFCLFFVFEICIRFCAFKCASHAFDSGWFVFDFVMVTLMVWETWITAAFEIIFGANNSYGNATSLLRMLRLVRVLRAARAVRLLHSFPELMILVKGILEAVRSVLAVVCFLAIILYVFGVLFTQLLIGTDVASGIFENVPQSINTLLRQVLCGADSDIMNSLLAADWTYYVVFLVFLLIAQCTIMNMLIGILCSVVSEAAESSKEESLVVQMDAEINRLAEVIDVDHNGQISKAEFKMMATDPVVTRQFYNIGIDIVAAMDYAKLIFKTCNEISFSDFRHVVSQFRGSKPATIKDLMHMRKVLSLEFSRLESLLLKDDGGEGPSSSPLDVFAQKLPNPKLRPTLDLGIVAQEYMTGTDVHASTEAASKLIFSPSHVPTCSFSSLRSSAQRHHR